MKLSLSMVGMLCAVAAFGSPQPLGLNENNPYGRLTSEYVTPHVAWGDPYYAGKIRALVLAPIWSQRETVELAERLALDYTPWMTTDFVRLVKPASSDLAFRFFQLPPAAVNRAIEEALKKEYDVIIVGKLDWQIVPPRQRMRLLERVAKGTGLLYVNPQKPHKELDAIATNGPVAGAGDFILAGVPVAHLPALSGVAGDKLVRTAQFGKGRVVFLDYVETVPSDEWDGCSWPCLTPAWGTNFSRIADGPAPMDKLPEAQRVPYEYYQSLVAKAAVWAAGKDSPIKVQVGIAATLAWPVAGREFSVTLQNAPAGTELKASVRDRYDRAIEYALTPSTSSFALPPLACGDYFLDVWALSPGGETTYTWHSIFFSVTNEFAFSGLAITNTEIEGGDTVNGAVALSRPLQDDERLTLDVFDNYGRLLLSQTLPAASTTAPFSFVMPAPLTTMHRIEVRLVRGGQDVARKTIQFPVRCRARWNEFNEVVWGGGGGNNAIPFLSLEKLIGRDEVDTIYICWFGPTVARNIALGNALLMPYQARYGCFSAGTNHIVPADPKSAYGCMSHPTTFEQLKKWGEQQSAMLGPYGPLGWSHGDETLYSTDPDLCWCEHCLEVFHNYLKSVYPSLDALNAEWKTAYTDWKAVTPVTFKDAQEKGVYAPWVEHCLANDRVFSDFYRKSGEALAAHDPNCRAGFDGGCGLELPNGGSDWWRLSRNQGLLHSYMYNEEQLEVIRSFTTPRNLSGQFYGTYGLTWIIGPNTVPFCHFFPWNSVFHGLNFTLFWTMGNPGPLSGYAPDLTSLPFFESRTETLRTIKHGIGKLIMNSRRDHDGIAVHFSEASRIADALYGPPADIRSEAYTRSLADVNRALQDAGLQYQYLSYEQVAQGELIKQGCKVFFMPHSRSVSDAECKAIREFVQKGGMAIADILPAVLNGHGTPQPASVLADLFPNSETGVVHVVGQGKTILLGDLLKGYGNTAIENQQGWKKLGDQSAKLAKLLADAAGIQPAVRVAPRGEGRMPPTEVFRFHAGDVQLVGLLRGAWMYDDAAYPATIVFPKESHLYDLLSGAYLGFTNALAREVSYRAHLYAMSPYRVQAVKISGPAACAAGAAAVLDLEAQAEGGAVLSKHVFRVEVAGPDGRDLPRYARNVLAEKGKAQCAIPWALNDKPGGYTITARDVMSGVDAKFHLELKEAK